MWETVERASKQERHRGPGRQPQNSFKQGVLEPQGQRDDLSTCSGEVQPWIMRKVRLNLTNLD